MPKKETKSKQTIESLITAHREGYALGNIEGYNRGHTAGYNKGKSESCDEAYNDGYSDGLSEGTTSAEDEMCRNCERVDPRDLDDTDEHSRGYKEGYRCAIEEWKECQDLNEFKGIDIIRNKK